jgi:hypothetical protein
VYSAKETFIKINIDKCLEGYYRGYTIYWNKVYWYIRYGLRGGLKFKDEKYYDYRYFKEKGWFESDYYYETSLGPIKKLSGYMFDFLGQKIGKSV